MLRLSTSHLEILVKALGHESKVLEHFTREPVMNLKLLHLSPTHTAPIPCSSVQARIPDFGALTILLQQPGADGLQVYEAREGEWMPIPATEDVFVVNMGDLVQKWTGGKYASTLHRVINAAGGDRYSVPCFYHGDLGCHESVQARQEWGHC